jgi:hypothetical protein
MKTKKSKLTLKKATIANLNNLELANVYGGVETDGCTFTDCCTFDFTNCKLCQIETIEYEPGEYTYDCWERTHLC